MLNYCGVMRTLADVECWLTDMDGVLVHENKALPGAADLIQQWLDRGTEFLVLTNNSMFTPRDLAARFEPRASTCPRSASGRARMRPPSF